MRLVALELEGFRGFATRQHLELDADAVLILGPNGLGKTSMLDGILWGLTGKVARLGGDDRHLVSKYSGSRGMNVSLDLRHSSGNLVRVVRSFDGEQQSLRLDTDGETVEGTAAKARLLELLWQEGSPALDGETALAAALTRSVYLQQDLVREFIDADDEQKRFNVVSELFGMRRLTDFQLKLERERKSWSEMINLRVQDAQVMHRRVADLEAQLAGLAAPEAGGVGIEKLWREWWESARELGPGLEEPPSLQSREASAQLDGAVKQLEALRRQNERRRVLARELVSDLVRWSTVALEDQDALRERLATAELGVDGLRKALADAEERAAEARRGQVERRQLTEELRVLASVALRHLGDRCPVCGQTYDRPSTESRLKVLAAGLPAARDKPEFDPEEVSTIAARLSDAEQAYVSLQGRLREAELKAREWNAWLAELNLRLTELGIDPAIGSKALDAVRELEAAASVRASRFTDLQKLAERLVVELARVAEIARRAELEEEVARGRREAQELDREIKVRERARDATSQIIDGLRQASLDAVASQLKQIEPLLQRIYATAEPHPTFRDVRILTSVTYGRGRLSTAVEDLAAKISTDKPGFVLSSSQANVLAVSIFLALNLGTPAPPLRTVILDDPQQSLDAINLLGLMDLLRRLRELRQVVVSTHDSQLGRLLERKLRPVKDGQATVVLEFKSWSREGPVVSRSNVPQESKPLRVAV